VLGYRWFLKNTYLVNEYRKRLAILWGGRIGVKKTLSVGGIKYSTRKLKMSKSPKTL